MNDQPWSVVCRLEGLVEPWEGLTSVGPVEIGRSFAKSSEAHSLISKLGPIAERASAIKPRCRAMWREERALIGRPLLRALLILNFKVQRSAPHRRIA